MHLNPGSRADESPLQLTAISRVAWQRSSSSVLLIGPKAAHAFFGHTHNTPFEHAFIVSLDTRLCHALHEMEMRTSCSQAAHCR